MHLRPPLCCLLVILSLASATQAVAGTGRKPVAAPLAVAATPPVIERFTVKPIDKIEPGAELKLLLAGTPRARATFTIDDVARDIPMAETQPGVYEGSYTIRRMDNLPTAINISALLEANGQIARTQLAQPLQNESKAPVIKNPSPRDGETVVANPVLVSAVFEDASGLGIDPRTVRVLLSGNDVSRQAGVTPQFFSYRTDLQPGTYAVDVSARDTVGRTVHQAWTFTVAAAAVPPTTVLPMHITSHANNAQVGPGAIELRGRTAADARLDVQVQAVASIAGFFGMTQQIYAQTLKADANGNFMFTFQPQVTVAGTRYEVTINASKGDMSKEMKLMLFQQK